MCGWYWGKKRKKEKKSKSDQSKSLMLFLLQASTFELRAPKLNLSTRDPNTYPGAGFFPIFSL